MIVWLWTMSKNSLSASPITRAPELSVVSAPPTAVFISRTRLERSPQCLAAKGDRGPRVGGAHRRGRLSSEVGSSAVAHQFDPLDSMNEHGRRGVARQGRCVRLREVE